MCLEESIPVPSTSPSHGNTILTNEECENSRVIPYDLKDNRPLHSEYHYCYSIFISLGFYVSRSIDHTLSERYRMYL